MLEIRTRALVLRTFDQGESDRIVHLYTESVGRVSAVAKGARRSRKRFPGTLEILQELDVRLVDPPRASMMRLEAARVIAPFEELVTDIGRYAIACQFVELLNRFTGDRQASPDLYVFASGLLGVLREERADRLLALLVLGKTLSRLGYRPQLAQCTECGLAIEIGEPAGFEPRLGGAVCEGCLEDGAERFPGRLLLALDLGIRTPLRDRGQLGLGPEEVRRAEAALERFFQFHIGLELKTTPFLRVALEQRPVPAAPQG